MRILELAWEYPPHVIGGIGSHITALVPALRDLGAAVTVVTPLLAGGAAHEQLPGLTIHRVAVGGAPEDWYARVMYVNDLLSRAAEALESGSFPFDIIHAHDWLVGAAAARLKHRFRVPLLATVHATERGRNNGSVQGGLSLAISRAEWQLTFEAWRVDTVSRSMATELAAFFSLPADKIDVVPNGVDTSPYDALEAEAMSAFRARHVAETEKLVFSIGRMVYEKGAHVLVEATPAVLARVPHTKLVLAGKGSMLDVLRARADALGIAANCSFMGYIDDAERDAMFKVADCAVFPSLYEPFGIVALEAMAARCPVVASAVGGLAEVVRPGETGLSVPPMSIGALADAIAITLEDPAAAQLRAERAYADVRQHYSWRSIAEQKLAIMQRICAERAVANW
ncbi:MAG: glycosyltransferase family 4 protein [Chloroflexi bacterium]|nr:glycosyltransferase family 4 protein [Chloroflexota bacterium]